MPEATATLGSTAKGQVAVKLATDAKNREMNTEYNLMGNANSQHAVEYFVYIFNVSDVEVKIERPWVSYNPGQGAKVITVPAREPGERVSRPYKIADIVQIPIRNDIAKTVSTIGQRGEFLAQDAINPEDPTGNWKTVRQFRAGQSINEGTNLYHWGLFWTKNETPADEEIEKAMERLESNYNNLIAEAKTLWSQGDKGKQQIGVTHRRAASYFNLEFEWNALYKSQKECPNCGAKLFKTAVACPNCPATFDWEKAMSLGLRTMDQAVAAGVMDPALAKGSKKAS